MTQQPSASADFRTRVLGFVKRHVWSLSLTGLSVLSFLSLARELQQNELSAFDQAVSTWLQGSRGNWDGLMLALTHLGEGRHLAIVCGLVTATLVWLGKRREGLFLLACSIGVGVGSVALKLVFQRVRPDLEAPYLVDLPASFSFPSGHAMGSIGVLGGLVVIAFALRPARRWRVAALALGLALVLGIAASRVYFGVHYPSDVLGGQLAGAAWVAAMTGWFYPRLLPAEAATDTGDGPSQL